MIKSNAQFLARKALLKRGIWTLIEQGESLETILKVLVENIESQSEKMLAAVFLYNPARNDLTIGAAPNLRPIYKKAINGFKCGPDQPACGSAAFKGEQVIAVDVRTDPKWKDLRESAEAIGILSVWSQPILSESKAVLGTMAFYFPEPKAPDTSDLIILEASASVAGEILQARYEQMKGLVSANLLTEVSRHQCMIYDGAPSKQLPVIASMVREKIEEGYRCLYLNSPPMISGFRSAISALGVDVVKEIEAGRLVLSSDTPATEDSFDIDGMLVGLEETLNQAIRDGFKGLFATGDMTWEFGSEKNFSKLMEYEYRLEKFFKRREEFCGICQYHKDTLTPEATRHGVLSHQSFFISETVSRVNPHFVPTGWVTDQLASDSEIDELIANLCSAQKVW